MSSVRIPQYDRFQYVKLKELAQSQDLTGVLKALPLALNQE
ncbi:hypothetical protein SLEP1_g9090 [Rubroshorea leprosula]|uniref:Uncharacterized protein n=1 Tax=Rubroshorea leprosula TaxID=152421 RepID=A0AAV5IF12_9ROSI|nr:hypothetical protein SLEP1_g9090 [Rubroshorea leprosula]